MEVAPIEVGGALEKIVFPAAMARDGIVESMHCSAVDGGFQLENSPFYVYGVSYRDIVGAENDDGRLSFTHVIRRGGHSTYRILVREAQATPFTEWWGDLALLGCTYEQGGSDVERLYAVDVPPGTDVHAVFVLLEQGEVDDIWTFEEGHHQDGAAHRA